MLINKDTKIYGSFSKNPGNNGCEFFNLAFEKYKINAIYKSFYSNDIAKITEAVKTLGFSGFAVSMPYKVEILKYLDSVDEDAKKIGACNTILLEDNRLVGYNTDWLGIYNFFKPKNLKHINIIGTGGFSKSISYAFSLLDINFSFVDRKNIKNIDDVENEYFINATPIEIISSKNYIIDARPTTTEGKNIFILQAIEQFKLYTGKEYV